MVRNVSWIAILAAVAVVAGVAITLVLAAWMTR